MGFRKLRAGTASQAEGTAYTMAQRCERAWLIPGTREGQHSRAGRARRQVGRKKAAPVSRDRPHRDMRVLLNIWDFILYH